MLRSVLVALAFAVVLGSASTARAESDLLGGVRLLESVTSTPGSLQLVPRLSAADETNGLLPCTLSCLLPGLGQLFNGQILKGLLLVGAAVATVSITAAAGVISVPGLLALGLTIAVWVVATIDAYTGGTLLPNWGGPEPEKKQVIRTEETAPPTHPVAGRRV